MTVREHLREEHGAIMKVLALFQKLIRDPGRPRDELFHDLETIFDFMEVYVDRSHHGKEEDILFPALEDARAADLRHLVAALRDEHREARGLLDELKAELQTSKMNVTFPTDRFTGQSEKYISLIRTHIRKENGHLLPEIERILPGAEQDRIEQAFKRFSLQIEGLQEIRRALDISG